MCIAVTVVRADKVNAWLSFAFEDMFVVHVCLAVPRGQRPIQGGGRPGTALNSSATFASVRMNICYYDADAVTKPQTRQK
jgi:hypothetical protein